MEERYIWLLQGPQSAPDFSRVFDSRVGAENALEIRKVMIGQFAEGTTIKLYRLVEAPEESK